MKNLYLRNADAKDMLLYYWWVNDKEVRLNAFNSNFIRPEEHRDWFYKAISNGDIFMYILMMDDIPVGQVRLNKEHDIFYIDYSIDKNYRGLGLGKKILLMVEDYLPNNIKIIGQVKFDNKKSQRAFDATGYVCVWNASLQCWEFSKYRR